MTWLWFGSFYRWKFTIAIPIIRKKRGKTLFDLERISRANVLDLPVYRSGPLGFLNFRYKQMRCLLHFTVTKQKPWLCMKLLNRARFGLVHSLVWKRKLPPLTCGLDVGRLVVLAPWDARHRVCLCRLLLNREYKLKILVIITPFLDPDPLIPDPDSDSEPVHVSKQRNLRPFSSKILKRKCTLCSSNPS